MSVNVSVEIEHYKRMVGDSDTLARHVYAQQNCGLQAPARNYQAREGNPYTVEPDMTSRGCPTLSYLQHSPGYDATYLGKQARPVLIDVYSARIMADARITSSRVEHHV